MFDFSGLASVLQSRVREFLPVWLPGGRLTGKEYECGDINGGQGRSLKVNIETGLWSDFAAGIRGGDLISLYAAVERIQMKDAYEILANEVGFNKPPPKSNGHAAGPVTHSPTPEKKTVVMIPPNGTPAPEMKLKGQDPDQRWEYKNNFGRHVFYVARYDTPQGKEFRPWSWMTDGKWHARAWPDRRPLYGVELLSSKPALVVEGEKATDAARKFARAYDVVTWSGGSKAVQKTDWLPLKGKKILLWPDADKPGRMAMEEVSQILFPACPEIKIINVDDLNSGWDAADSAFDWDGFIKWAKPRVRQLKPTNITSGHVPAFRPPPSSPPPSPVVVMPDDEKRVSVEITEPSPPIEVSKSAVWYEAGIITAGNGQPPINADTFLCLLEYLDIFKKHIWYDDFHNKIFTTWDNHPVRPWKDSDDTNLTRYFQRALGLHKATEEHVRRAIYLFAERNVRNEPRDWMNSLTWDEVPRIDLFMTTHMGAADTDYSRASGRVLWLSMANRIFVPGSKCDQMLILEGKQGTLKSTCLAAIAGKWFAEASESPTTKDFFLSLQGKLIMEVPELDVFSRAEVNTLKRVLTCTTDNFRTPFGRYTQAHPRQGIFCGSTNDDKYLNDPTGGRRFLPNTVNKIELEKIKDDREQLFAEAVARFKQGEAWWELPESSKDEQEARRIHDAWEPVIHEWVKGKLVVETHQVGLSALKIDIGKLGRSEQLRIGKILRSHGWKSVSTREEDGIKKRWVRES